MNEADPGGWGLGLVMLMLSPVGWILAYFVVGLFVEFLRCLAEERPPSAVPAGNAFPAPKPAQGTAAMGQPPAGSTPAKAKKARRRVHPPRRSPVSFNPGELSRPGPRFHLDVNVSHRVAAVLRESRIDVTTAHDVGLARSGDRAHIAFCARERRIWVTHDLRARPLVAEMYHAGVLFAEGGGRYEDEIIRCCLLLAERGEEALTQPDVG